MAFEKYDDPLLICIILLIPNRYKARRAAQKEIYSKSTNLEKAHNELRLQMPPSYAGLYESQDSASTASQSASSVYATGIPTERVGEHQGSSESLARWQTRDMNTDNFHNEITWEDL